MFDRVEMQIVQVPGEIRVVPDHVVVVTSLPGPQPRGEHLLRQAGECGALEASHQRRNLYAMAGSQQQVQVIIQQDMPVMVEGVVVSYLPQSFQNEVAMIVPCQPGAALVGDESEEDGLAVTEVAAVAGHGTRFPCCASRVYPGLEGVLVRRGPEN